MDEFGLGFVSFGDVGFEGPFREWLFGKEMGLLFDGRRFIFLQGLWESDGVFVGLDGVVTVLLDVLVHEVKFGG